MATKMVKTSAENETAEVIEEPVKKVRKDYITCRSVTPGELLIGCPSGNNYRFIDYGVEFEIENKDLVSLIRNRSSHIFEPRIVIEDEDFLADYPTVKQVYDNMYTKDDFIAILSLPDAQMQTELTKIPSGAYDAIKSVIASAIANGTLDSIRKVRILSDFFGSDFNFLSELFSK